MEIDANIIDLKRHNVHGAVFPAIAQVEAYWHGLRRGSPLPHRGDIDPRALESALEFTFVLERIAPGICRFRIAGRHLTDLMGMDVAGMPISAMFSVEDRAEIGRIVEEVCAEPCLTEVILRGARSLGRGAIDGKMFLAPLLDDTGKITRVLGCLQTNGNIGRQPRRFSITNLSCKKLGLWPTTRSQLATPHTQHAFSEAPVAFEHRPAKTGRPALHLVVNNV